MRATSLLSLAFVPFVFAAVKFNIPSPGQSITALSFQVSWADDGAAPALSTLKSYNIQLYAGADATLVPLGVVASGTFATGSTATVTIAPGLGGNVQNAYVLGIESTPISGAGTIINYSSRFTLASMTGTFNPPLTPITVTTPPPTKNQIAAAAPAAPGTPAQPADEDFAVAYTAQTGTIRYAPMQPVPPTKITATNTAPLYPTSSVVLATTFLAPPKIATTLTQPQTFKISSHANTAAPASSPVDDMAKYLNRWKD